jgi:hypothetical protein
MSRNSRLSHYEIDISHVFDGCYRGHYPAQSETEPLT